MLVLVAIIMIITGIAHSYLGERYILIRLFRRNDLPAIFGNDQFTKSTLRFAWHITSITWFGIAVILMFDTAHSKLFLITISIVCFISALMAAFFTRGKHLSWIVFLLMAGLILFSLL
ncbi:hypothetical protein [Paraglaciecola sp.]|uniref:hypothetical protein n=1 Tax=Paraglaciecola sp. TaxID=1920173 RepID=UPI003EF671C1